MRKWLIAGLLCIAATAGAIVVASSSAGGGKQKPYFYYSGPVFLDDTSKLRADIANVGSEPAKVTVTFYCNNTPEEPVVITIPSGDASPVLSDGVGCEARVAIKSKSDVLAPTLVFSDTDATPDRQHVYAGDFIVVRDGKRIR